MKIQIDQPKLLQALAAPLGIVESRNTIPILGHVKLTADTGLTVTATDLDMEATTTTDAEVYEVGETTVPAKTFMDIVKRIPKGKQVQLDCTSGNLRITAGTLDFTLNTLPAHDFPVMASDSYDNTSQIEADVFADMLNKTKFAMSAEETRFYLQGVYMHNDDAGDLHMVATDGHRLAKMTHQGSVTVSSVIIPRKAVMELVKLMEQADATVTLDTSETKIRVTGDGFSVVSKVVDGTFPDYTRVIPSSHNRTMHVDAKEFSAASASVTVVSDDRTKAVKMSVADDVCVLSVRGATGEAKAEVAVDYDGDAIDIGFNSKYLAEMMAQANGGTVTVEMSGPMDPAKFLMDDTPGFVGVNMPLRM